MSTLSVPAALQFLGSHRRTGVLILQAGARRKELVLQEGAIAFCTAGRAKERLGHHVLARTSVTESDLDSAFQQQDRTGRRLGELLVGDGRIQELELQTVLRTKLEDAVHDLFTWPVGTFEWREAPEAPEVPARLDLPWESALLGGGERADLTQAALGQLGGRTSVLSVGNWQGVFDSGLSVRNRDLVNLASLGLSVDEICATRHETDFELLSALARLVGEGLLAWRTAGSDRIEPLPPEQSLSLARSWLDQGHLLEVMDLLFDLARHHPANADVALTLSAAESLVRMRLERDLGGLQGIPSRVDEASLDQSKLSARGRAVLQRVNSRWPLASLVRISPLGELETLLVVRTLFRQGLLNLLPGEAAEAAREPVVAASTAPKRLAALEPEPGGRSVRRIGQPEDDHQD